MGNVVVDNVLLCLDLREGECLFWSLLSPTSHNLINACFIYPPPLFHSTLKLFYFIFVSSYFCLRPLTSFSLHSHTLVPQLSSPDDVDSLQFDDIRWLLSPSWNNRFVPPLPIPPGADRLSCFPPSPSSSSYSSSPSLSPICHLTLITSFSHLLYLPSSLKPCRYGIHEINISIWEWKQVHIPMFLFFFSNFIGREPSEWLPRSHDKDLLWLINIYLIN